MSGRSENDSFKLLELKLNLEGNMADKIQNAYETSKNIYDDPPFHRNSHRKKRTAFHRSCPGSRCSPAPFSALT